MISRVACSHTVETAHPFLEPAAAGVDVLDRVDTCNHPDACGQIDRAMTDACLPRDRAQCTAPSVQSDDIACQGRLEYSSNVFLVRFLQNEVGGVSDAIPANQGRSFFIGQAALRSFASPLARRTRQPAFLVFSRLKKECFVGIGNACQSGRLLGVGPLKETMPPAQGGVAMRLAGLCALTHAIVLRHLLGVFQPLVLVSQTRQRRPR